MLPYQKFKYKQYTFQEEIELLKGIKENNPSSLQSLLDNLAGLIRYHTSKYFYHLDPQEFKELNDYVRDNLVDLVYKKARKYWRHRLSPKTGKPSLTNYLSVHIRYLCLKFVIKREDRKWYQKHQKVDRRRYILSEIQQKDLDKRLERGTSPYKLARAFSLSSGEVFLRRRKILNPVSYETYVKRGRTKQIGKRKEYQHNYWLKNIVRRKLYYHEKYLRMKELRLNEKI